MKSWFIASGGKDHGPYSHVPGLTAKPVVWQGWFITVAYFAVLAGIVAFHLPQLGESALVFGSLMLGMIAWHLAVLGLASRKIGCNEET